MKKIIFFICLFCQSLGFSQISNLSELAVGKTASFHALIDRNGKFFGYFCLYDKGAKSSIEKTFEVIILDKNLSEIIRRTFETDLLISTYWATLDMNYDIIMNPILDYTKKEVKKRNFLLPEYKLLDLKKGEISKYHLMCYENNKLDFCTYNKTIKSMVNDEKKEKKENGFIKEHLIYRISNKGYLVFEYDAYKRYNENYRLEHFTTEKEPTWNYSFVKSTAKNVTEQLQIISIDTTHIFALRMVKFKANLKAELLIFETKTGNLIKKENINGLKENELRSIWSFHAEGSFKSVDNIENQKDKLIILGKTEDDWKINTGYFRILVDKVNNFSVKISLFNWENDVKRFITNINEYGRVEKGYKLAIRDIFYLKDGSLIFLFEKYKDGINFWTGLPEQKTTDLTILKCDPDFKILIAKVINKELSKYGNDYLFSRYLNDEKDIAFFYADYVKDGDGKEKNWILFINTIIGGIHKVDSMKISSKKYLIYPYIAKEGYILLREFNEKESHNSIRLEKINY